MTPGSPMHPDQPVTVVCSDLSTNCLGRALVLAELASAYGPTRIVGCMSEKKRWPPAASTKVEIVERRLPSSLSYFSAVRWFKKQLNGSKVIVSKPVFTSLGLARLAGVQPSQMLLDNDDWELGLRSRRASKGAIFRSTQLANPVEFNSYYSTSYLAKQLKHYPHMTASNAWLREMYGGEVLPHVRDTDWLNPLSIDRVALRDELQMTGRLWVGFVGTVRPHKGVDNLIDVLSEFSDSDAPGLYVAGVNLADAYYAALKQQAEAKLGANRVRFRPPFDFAQLREQVAPVDIICLPGLDDPGATGQLPAKLMDAMAMAKPVVASGHNDIAQLLDGCGEAITPGSVVELRKALTKVLESATLRETYGTLARKRAEERLSYAKGREIMCAALESVPVFGGRS